MPRSKLVRMFSSYHTNEEKEKPNKKFDFYHHPCVAPQADADGHYAACTEKDITLNGYVKKLAKSTTRGSEIPLLIQMTHALGHIHEAKKVVKPLGGATQILKHENFKISEDGKHVVLAGFSHDDADAQYHTRKTNIKELGILFYWILNPRGTCPAIIDSGKLTLSHEPVLAAHLINLMCTSIDDTNSILKHPYFWSDAKKLYFLISVWNLYELWIRMSKVSEQNKYKKLVEPLNSLFKDGKDWDIDLEDEVDDESDDESANDSPDPNAVAKLLKDFEDPYKNKHPANYNKLSGFGLLRFIRNCVAHYWDNGKAHRNVAELLGGRYDGVWKFFNGKFPHLFLKVYDFANKHPFIKNNIEKDYLTDLAKMTDLVQVHVPSPRSTSAPNVVHT